MGEEYLMKILFISDYYPPHINGGAEISTSLLARWFFERGHSVAVACSQFADTPWVDNGITVYPVIFKPSVRPKNIVSAMMSGLTLVVLQIRSAVRVLRLMRELQPDIVNIVPSSYRFVPVIIGIRMFSKCPVVVDCRDYSLVCPAHLSPSFLDAKKDFDETTQTHHGYRCIGYTSVNDPTFLSIRPFALYESIMFNVYKSALRFLVNHFSRIQLVAVSKFVQGQLILNGFKEEKTTTIYNISQSIEPMRQGVESSIPTFAFAGRVERDKGVWDLIAAIETLQRESPKPFAVQIAGTGGEFDNLDAYIKEHDLTCVTLLGYVTLSEVLGLYAKSLAIIAPSRWPEPFGRFILESISVGKPIIATRSGGISENIEQGVTGFLVDVGNVEQLAGAMKYLIEYPEQSHTMREAIIERQKYYKADFIGSQRFILYQDLLQVSLQRSEKNVKVIA